MRLEPWTLAALFAAPACDYHSADVTKSHAPPSPDPVVPCDLGEVNGLGLGRPCGNSYDCWESRRQPSVWVCPKDFHPELRTYCTRICEYDADCGDDGRCLEVFSTEGGIILTCYPVGCEPPDWKTWQQEAG